MGFAPSTAPICYGLHASAVLLDARRGAVLHLPSSGDSHMTGSSGFLSTGPADHLTTVTLREADSRVGEAFARKAL